MSTVDATLVALCNQRAPSGTICPSEVARALWPNTWRDHMDEVRAIGRTLALEGKIEITQGGVVRDPHDEIRGAIRYRLRR